MHPILLAAALAALAVPAAETDCPHEPGCPAMTVLHEVELDNSHEYAFLSVRIVRRFFTQEGIERHADIQLAEDPYFWDLKGIQGKVTLPDGTVVPFGRESAAGTKTLETADGKAQIVSITPPGLVPGATVEFSYRRQSRRAATVTRYDWAIQELIPVLAARFTLRQGALQLSWKRGGLEPVSIAESSLSKGVIQFAAEQVRSIPIEPWSAPLQALAARLSFYSVFQADWLGQLAGQLAGKAGAQMEVCGKTRARALELTQASAAPLANVRALYGFVQEKIARRETSRYGGILSEAGDAASVDEILARGFGDEWERTLLFLAMVREVGLEQGLLAISSRFHGTLNTSEPDEGQFDTFAAAVKTSDKWTFYDVGERNVPLAMVAAHKESPAPNAILVTPKKGEGYARRAEAAGSLATVYDKAPYLIATIPFSQSERNSSTRLVTLKLGDEHAVEVEVAQTAAGLSEMDLRRTYADLDEAGRRSALTDDLHTSNSLAELREARFENLETLEQPVKIVWTATLPGVVARFQDRLVIEASVFDANRAPRFAAASRRTAVQLPHTEKSVVRVLIEVPAGFVVRELPERQVIEEGSLKLSTFYGRDMDRVVLTRTLQIGGIEWQPGAYPQLKAFFEKVRQADQQPLVLWAEGVN